MAEVDTHSDENTEDQTPLKRVMGPKLLLLFIVGDILGAGVYAVTGDVAAQVGGMAWLPFLVAFSWRRGWPSEGFRTTHSRA